MARVVKETQEVVRDDDEYESPSTYTVNTAARIVYAVATIIIALLAFRFVLALLGANKGNAFTDFIYITSQPFVAPFFGMFNYRTNFGVSNFEVETLFAIAAYAIISWVIVRLLEAGDTHTTTRSR